MERVANGEAATHTDREVVARCQAGDEAAFDELVLRHRERASHIAYPLLLDHEDATEVAQDAFMKIYRCIGEFRGECEFTTWLYQIVINLARNKHRWWNRRGKHATASRDCPVETAGGDTMPQMAAPTDAPGTEVAKSEFMQTLSVKIADLPPKFREVLLLRNVQGMRYEQISVMLGCSGGTVKSRIACARGAPSGDDR